MDTYKQMKIDLIEFHRNSFSKDLKEKIVLLKKMSEKKYLPVLGYELLDIRERFLRNKRHLKYFKRPCFCCSKKSEARHHVILLKHGGLNAKRNIVAICHLCHSKIHPWLDKSLEQEIEALDKEFKMVVG